MILQAAADLSLDLARSAMVGDQISDMEAAAAAGIPVRILVGAGEGKGGGPSFEPVADLAQALALLRSRFTPPLPA
jgi:D-glycero-D-manno-heptose 1,7-bisphosphate phosphatase